MGLALVFSVGFIAVLASCLRLNPLVKTSTSLDDAQWDATGVIVWSSVEINVAIMCTCIACVKPLIVRAFGVKRSTTKSSHHDGTEISPYVILGEHKAEGSTDTKRPDSEPPDPLPDIIAAADKAL